MRVSGPQRVHWVGGGISTRAAQRNIGPCPLHVSVAFPAPLRLTVFPMSKFPVNPGATTWHDGTGFELGTSDTAFKQVSVAGPVISAVAGCTPLLSEVACSECTFPRRCLCALPLYASASRATESTANNEIRFPVFIEHLRWPWIVHSRANAECVFAEVNNVVPILLLIRLCAPRFGNKLNRTAVVVSRGSS